MDNNSGLAAFIFFASAILNASSCPKSFCIIANDISVPVETPYEVKNFPSSSYMAYFTYFTMSFWLADHWKACLFDLAYNPSMIPVLARIVHPV